MKKKAIKELKEMKANVDNLKDMRFLLKGMNIDKKHVKIGKEYPEWPVTAVIKEGGVLEIAYDRIGYLNNSGYYYCEFQGDSKEKECNVYLSFYDHLRVKELLISDKEAEIDERSFFQFGINPSFQMYTTKEKLQDKEENFVEIMNKKMKKTLKKAQKLSQKI